MLSESKINVFDSQEAKPYESAKEIVAMTQLTDAFLHDEIKEFGKSVDVHGFEANTYLIFYYLLICRMHLKPKSPSNYARPIHQALYRQSPPDYPQ